MFQNIAKEFENTQDSYDNLNSKNKSQIIEIISRVFTKQNIVLYIICFLISMVKFNLDGGNSLSVFALWQ